MTYSHLAAQIEKTGFVLENRIAQLLKAAKWTVISNKYYVDDTTESVREIDLVAYRTSRVLHFDVYTTLIVSCKKSESDLWALLAREINLKDPNADWQPLHIWSNDKILVHQLGRLDARKSYHEGIMQLGVDGPLQVPAVEVFAFQAMNKVTGAPQNDKLIFDSITSLMKAQAHELSALPKRKKTPAVYQFNLLSVAETDLVRLMFNGREVKPIAVDTEHYTARYIIKKQETFARIRFIRASVFETVLREYDSLHSANCRWFETEYDSFYKNVLEDDKHINVLIDEFRKEVRHRIRMLFVHHNLKLPNIDSLEIEWSEPTKSAIVRGEFGVQGEQLLNSDTNVKNFVAKALLTVYRYSGSFRFSDFDIPF